MGLISKLFGFLLAPKYKKEAYNMVNSTEYQGALKDLQDSTKELNKSTQKLQPLVDEYESLIKGLQKDGVPVKMGMDISEMQKLIRKQHAALYTKYNLDKKRF
jgi:hypothetical protein